MRKWLWVWVVAWVVAPGWAQTPAVLAVVEGQYAVTTDDVERELAAIRHRPPGTDSDALYRTALDAAILSQLKRLDGVETGFYTEDRLQSVGRRMTEERIRAYVKRQYEDAYLNEEALQAEYDAYGRSVVVQTLVLSKPRTDAEALAAVRDAVRTIQNRLRAGMPFDTVLASLRTGSSGPRVGLLRDTISWRASHASMRTRLLFDLPVDSVRSFETPTALGVSQVDAVLELASPPTFEAVRATLVEALHDRYAKRASDAFEAERQAIVDSTALRWNPAGLAQVVAWSRTPGFYESDYAAVVTSHVDVHGDAVIARDTSGALRWSDLPRLFREVLTLGASRDYASRDVEAFLVDAMRTDRLAARARALGLDGELLRPNPQAPAMATLLVWLYDQDHIESQIPQATPGALRAFYEATADSLFRQPEIVTVEVVVRESRAEIEGLLGMLRAGALFEAIASRRLVRSFARTLHSEIVPYRHVDVSLPAEALFDVRVGEVAGPLRLSGTASGFALARGVDRREARTPSLDDITPRVLDAYRDHHRARLAAHLHARLKARYQVDVQADALQQVLDAR